MKICGLTRMEDAELAVDSGADALGFVFHTASPRFVGNHPGAREIPARLGPFALCVAVFGEIPAVLPILPGISALQGEFDGPPEFAGWRIRTVRLRPGADEIVRTPGVGEAILLDAHDPLLHGGTGRTVDWDSAAEIVRSTQTKVILAGGLTPENVVQAIQAVRPYGVDVSSGVESSPGVKDHAKLRAFLQAVRSA